MEEKKEKVNKDPDLIPPGSYCYVLLEVNKLLRMIILKCPYWSLRQDKPQYMNGYCSFLERGDWEEDKCSLIWDQVKECNIRYYYKDERNKELCDKEQIEWFKKMLKAKLVPERLVSVVEEKIKNYEAS